MMAWLGAVAFSAVAVAALVWGARRRPPRPESPTPEAVFAAERQDLLADATAQALPQETVAALEEELALDVADVSSAPPAASVRTTAPTPAALFGGALALAALALALYGLWGEPQASLLADSAQLMAGEMPPERLAELVAALAARTWREPEDGDAWFHLGHARLRQRDFDGAAAAFASLHSLVGAQLQVDIAWAQASYLAAGGTVGPATQAIVDRVFAEHPEHPEMLELLAMAALRQNDFAGGAWFLARALRQPLTVGRRALLTETLALARRRLDPQRPLIEVTVTAAADAAPWLMVFARPVGGGMPLAVVRQPAQPTQTVILDAANRMAGDGLADANRVEVVARLSRTGTATDVLAEAISEPVSPAEQPRVTLALAASAQAEEPTADVAQTR